MKVLIDEELENSKLYSSLMNEMSKYKTLAHSEICWDYVFESSLELLKGYCHDAKILFYLVLGCITLNKDDKYREFNKVISDYIKKWKTLTGKLVDTDPKAFKIQKKFINNLLTDFEVAYNEGNLLIPKDLELSLFASIKELASLSGNPEVFFIDKTSEEEDSAVMVIEPSVNQSKETESAKVTINPTTQGCFQRDPFSMNEREYRDFFIHLAEGMLKINTANFTPYSLFMEAVWGKITKLPVAKDDICGILPPNDSLAVLFDEINDANAQGIIQFMNNLSLNPFWFEGQKLFMNFLKNKSLERVASFLASMIIEIIEKFPDLRKLKFKDGQNFCGSDCYKSFKSFVSDKGVATALEESTANNGEYLKSIKETGVDNQNGPMKELDFYRKMQKLNEDIYYGKNSDLDSLIVVADLMYEAGLKSNSALIYKQTFMTKQK